MIDCTPHLYAIYDRFTVPRNNFNY